MEHSPERDLDIEVEPGAALAQAEGLREVLLRADALAAMREHGQTDTGRECGGVMLGGTWAGPAGTVVVVEASIAAEHTEARRGSVTFTHDTWEQINRVKDEKYPELRMVGWYHTHPGFGIFLSEYDTFIQANFFDLPWQVALVLDPLSGETGVFGWEQGVLRRLGGFGVVRPAGQREAAPAREEAREAAVVVQQRRPALVDGVILGLLVAILGLTLWQAVRPLPRETAIPAPVLPPMVWEAPLPPGEAGGGAQAGLPQVEEAEAPEAEEEAAPEQQAEEAEDEVPEQGESGGGT